MLRAMHETTSIVKNPLYRFILKLIHNLRQFVSNAHHQTNFRVSGSCLD